jgi:hypothetical protein
MTKVLDRLRGAGRPKPLPENLDGLDHDKKRGALIARQERVKALARDAKQASTSEQREAIKTEMATVVAEIGELREAGAAIEPYRAKMARVGDRPTEKRTRAEVAARVIANNWLLPNELAGLTLHPENLSEEEADELLDLLKLRHAEGVLLDAEQTAHFRFLVEKLAGRACFAELDAQAEIERLVEEVRLDSLPKRLEYAEIGSVRLPASVFAELRASRNGAVTVGDVGALVCLLNAFEVQDASLIRGGHFDDDTLVGKGRELAFVPDVQAPFLALSGSKVEIDEKWLSEAGWFTFTRTGSGRIEVRLGPKANALREGRR